MILTESQKLAVQIQSSIQAWKELHPEDASTEDVLRATAAVVDEVLAALTEEDSTTTTDDPHRSPPGPAAWVHHPNPYSVAPLKMTARDPLKMTAREKLCQLLQKGPKRTKDLVAELNEGWPEDSHDATYISYLLNNGPEFTKVSRGVFKLNEEEGAAKLPSQEDPLYCFDPTDNPFSP